MEAKLTVFDRLQRAEPVGKKTYKARAKALRLELLQAQRRLRKEGFPVIVLLAGVDKAGKATVANLLNEWMDPRYLDTHAFDEPVQSERERPYLWRFWNILPPAGRTAILLGGWYGALLPEDAPPPGTEGFERRLAEINRFERALTDDGALVLKLWLHLDANTQKGRLDELEADPLRSWRVSRRDWDHWRQHGELVRAGDAVIQATDTPHAPWTLVDARDPEARDLRVGELLLEAVARRCATASPAAGEPRPAEPGPSVLAGLPMGAALDKDDYETALAEAQGRLHLLHRRAQARGIPAVLAFEGWDAAGKGGAIRRLLPALDARWYRIVRVAAPTDVEKAHHYLWRFWQHVPRDGHITIFDRSWYGRVLVERIEGFATPAEWGRAYDEINDFEQALVQHGTVVVKYWLHLTREEQAARFAARAETPHKKHKLTEEDERNRAQWDAYEAAVHDMVRRTDTPHAPWVLVAANDKRYARIRVIERFCTALTRALDG